jgi:hypothetical protein
LTFPDPENKAKIMPKRHNKAKIMPKLPETILKANNAALLILGFTGLFIAVSLLFLELTGCLELLMSLF